MQTVLVVALAAAIIGAIAAVFLLHRAAGSGRAARLGAPAQRPEGDSPRLHAQVHTGWEQTLIGLVRELRLPLTADDLPYGAIYADRRSEHRQYIRTRSEIGRGFIATLDIVAHHGLTTVGYDVLQLPSDDRLHVTVRDFERALIAALQRIDPAVIIRTIPDPLDPRGPGTPV